MPKANITLPDGTKIEIDGTLEEVQKLTEQYGRASSTPNQSPPVRTAPSSPTPSTGDEGDEALDVARIVERIKDCDEAEDIESKILDKRDALNRVLLCLWIVQKYFNPALGLTSGDIEKITDQLGVKIMTANASTVLSGKAKAFVSGDKVRKQGAPVRYRLNRRGVQAFEEVLTPS